MKKKLIKILKDSEGRLAVPILLWFLGMPASIVLLIWFLFYRGK